MDKVKFPKTGFPPMDLYFGLLETNMNMAYDMMYEGVKMQQKAAIKTMPKGNSPIPLGIRMFF